ncbi:MAG: alpha-ketoacid dehydrogenase subunit beta [SAR202 cluster bacterium]|nr:alpha-ketoacid dehydrogenase subunit beta [Chloroflexota bacterium]MQG16790.1 alpha-ketoacid dehydrogenase subunit beta [SAR202 cluster bacterium]MQG35389.1 alpha-ketoacid dehydrogenase subunit beta [SAR202 cluster bacterium]MQG86259.1 alpha-ketoacid dehydrogenase subunit beta [SAR202 cluster bacterium]|tara:strand:- start:6282 stop:7253 length:972 start_codon:yes stop_codon:yes gene_type:complete
MSTEMTYRQAICQGLTEALDEDPRVYLMGEDIGPYGGAFAVTQGFWEKYGPRRIKDSPLSESAFVGAGIGSAMAGLRPIVEIMTINFSLLAIDQIVNHAAKVRYMSGDQFSVPMIIRTVTGAGASVAATHSQSFEGWYASVPGLYVAVPSTPEDALGLFRTCRELMDPVMFVEHILLYGARGEVSDGIKIPLGKADVKKQGSDVTIISYSKMVQNSLEAAALLENDGINAEVVDLRTLRPLDVETIIASTKKTHRVVVVEETTKFGGFAGEVVSIVQQEAFDYLDAPVERVAGEEVPIPYSMPLEKLAIPDTQRIVSAVKKLI